MIRRRISWGRRVFIGGNTLFFALLLATMILPLVNVLAVSFSGDTASNDPYLKLLPQDFGLKGYVNLFQQVRIIGPILNTLYVTAAGTLLHILMSSMAGYVLVKERFPGKNLLVALIVLPMMIPFEMLIIPVYAVVRDLKLIDSLLSLIIMGAASTFSILLMRNFFLAVPKSIEESAAMDGASEILCFFRIYIPLALPGLLTITIFQFVSRWNHFLESVLFINDPEKYTLQRALNNLISEEFSFSTQAVANNTRMAGIVISVIPSILIYVIFQRYFIKGITEGALKDG